MWNKYRAWQDDRFEATRLRKLMPTFEHIPELIAPVTCGCRKIVSVLREDPRRIIMTQMIPTGDHFPVVAEVNSDLGFEKAILWLAGGAVREFLRDVSMQDGDAASGTLPVRRLRDDIFVLRSPGALHAEKQ
jgi:hypothetical protein